VRVTNTGGTGGDLRGVPAASECRTPVCALQSPGAGAAPDMMATAVAGDAEMRSVKYSFPTDFLTFQTIRTA